MRIKDAVIGSAISAAVVAGVGGAFFVGAGTALAPEPAQLQVSTSYSHTGVAYSYPARVVTSTFSVAAGARGVGTAVCTSGRVVGGGVGTTSDSVSSQVQDSGPVDETGSFHGTDDGDIARSWYASVKNGPAARTYKVFAVCSTNSDATVEATTVTSSSGSARVATACPSGKRVVGGGIGAVERTGQYEIRASGPLDETGVTRNTVSGDVARYWYGDVGDLSAWAQTFKVLALCSSSSDAIVAAAQFAVPTSSGAGQYATCPTGRRALGGGIGFYANSHPVAVSGPIGPSGATATTADGDAARYWYANVKATAADTAVVSALCASESNS